MAINLASSALKNEEFDLVRTIEEGQKNSFNGVQLFLTDKFSEKDYLNKVVFELNNASFENVIIHLPNLPQLSSDVIFAANYLYNSLPNKKVSSLIHYIDNMRIHDVPFVGKGKVGIENSKTGTFDTKHVTNAFNFSRNINSFFVFDPGRLMYVTEGSNFEVILNYIKSVIVNLDPSKDILHVTNPQRLANLSENETVICLVTSFGTNGVGDQFINEINQFHINGGLVVFENESLDQAVESLNLFIA